MPAWAYAVARDAFAGFYAVPIGLAALCKLFTGRPFPQAGYHSNGCLLPPPEEKRAHIRIVSTRGRAFRFAFGGHCYIVYKRHGDAEYTRWDVEGAGAPVRVTGWFPHDPRIPLQTFVWGADGARAEALIGGIENAVAVYARRNGGVYRRTIGPNSNTFIQGIIDLTPGIDAILPPTALGKDYPHDGKWVRFLPSGLHLTLGGWISLRLGWVAGFELGCPIAVAGIDVRRPAVKLAAIGRIGTGISPRPPYVPNSGRLPPRADKVHHPDNGSAEMDGALNRARRPGPQAGRVPPWQ